MSLLSLRRCFFQHRLSIIAIGRTSCRGKSSSASTDPYCIPTHPTWSVNQLLSSYPSPKLSSTTINRLYELSALVPPKEGSSQYDIVKRDLEEMVKLVEAADTDRKTSAVMGFGESGQELLKHASQVMDHFYVVDSERR
ncbi:hypothetical protein GALMADRAFT_85574 [Galerina marginata CBS 339.88]|uniref:Uncharacterized protein n=1 Tax=Galerina marginata (strain CBS 339.88) TaxID=685588 RepID=A0A067TK02_GALM3|nr:hypothetical protein GALMADRAFT_85574 [Galerina marginata CBS 339.88]